jgi:hypothetical protein
MLFALIMYLLGILTVFCVVGFLMLLAVISSMDKGRALPF